MVAAIWSMPPNLAKEMPLTLFLNFFKNHGLFKIKNRPDRLLNFNLSKPTIPTISTEAESIKTTFKDDIDTIKDKIKSNK